MLKLLHRLLHFRRSEEGIAYVEFAICLPFLMALLMGGIEITRYVLIAQKAEKVAVTLSDVVAQANTISRVQIDNIVYAASQVMLPYNFGANGYVIISSVTQTGAYTVNNPPIVNWQYTSSGINGSWTHASQVGTQGNTATLPNGMTLNDKDNIITAEVFYNYQPLLVGNGVISGSTLYQMGLYKPRLGALSTLGMLWFYPAVQKGAMS